MIVAYLPEPHKHPLWNDIQRLLDPRQEYGPVDPFDEMVWIAFDEKTLFGAGTTLLYDTHAEIRLCGGFRHREWVWEALRIVEAWARDAGASRLTMRGRKGWGRYMRPFGWGVSRDGDKWHYCKDL